MTTCKSDGMQISPKFTFSGYLTSWPQMTFDFDLRPLTASTYEGFHIISINQVWFKSDFNFSNEAIFTLSYNLTSDDFWPWYMTFDCMNIWRFTYFFNKPSLVQIGLQLFKWGHFHIFSLSYNLISDNLWPWYMTFDLICKWGFQCCTYDPNLVEIHQSMWKIEPNVNLFHNRQQQQQWIMWSLCVFPAKAGDTKTGPMFKDFL